MGKDTRKKSTQVKEPKKKAVSEVPNFSSAIIELSWRIAIPFMLLSLGGVKLDEKLGTEPAYSITGVFLAVLAVAVVVYKYVSTNFPGTFGGKR